MRCMWRRRPRKAKRRINIGSIEFSFIRKDRLLGRSRSPTCRGQSKSRRSGMAEVRLPEEVLEAILEHLPTVSLLRFTAVCKQWRDMISVRLKAWRTTVAEDWLLMISDGLHLGKLFAYNPAWEKWHSIRLPVDSNNRFPFAVAADGNFVCMSDRCFRKFGTYGRVAVCDPLLKLWHELPSLRSWGVIQGMAVDPSTRSVKILATNFLDSDDGVFELTCAELYDSSAGRWKIVMPPTPFLAADRCSVFCNSCFYYLDPSDSLFAFDLETESWKSIPASALPRSHPSRVHKKLLVCTGRILLLTVEVGKLVVWGLTSPGMEWTEVARAPEEVASRFLNHGCEEEESLVDCTREDEEVVHGYSSTRRWTASGEAHQDVLRVWAVTLGSSPVIFLKNSLLPQLLQLDLSRQGGDRWRWLVCPRHVPLSARPFSFSL